MVIFNSYVSLPEGMFSLPSYKWEKLLNTDLVTRVIETVTSCGMILQVLDELQSSTPTLLSQELRHQKRR